MTEPKKYLKRKKGKPWIRESFDYDRWQLLTLRSILRQASQKDHMHNLLFDSEAKKYWPIDIPFPYLIIITAASLI